MLGIELFARLHLEVSGVHGLYGIEMEIERRRVSINLPIITSYSVHTTAQLYTPAVSAAPPSTVELIRAGKLQLHLYTFYLPQQ
jgi:hypothetical protein